MTLSTYWWTLEYDTITDQIHKFYVQSQMQVGRYEQKYVDFYDIMIESDESQKLEYVVKTTHDI